MTTDSDGEFSSLELAREWRLGSALANPQEGNPMSFSIYDASIPPIIRSLENLTKIIDKAVAQAKSGSGK